MDKNVYYAKERYAERIKRENKNVDSLTEEQHDILDELCSFRHRLHKAWNLIFSAEAMNNEYIREIDSSYCGNDDDCDSLDNRVERAFGVKPYARVELITEIDYDLWLDEQDEDCSEEDKEEMRGNLFQEMCGQLNHINEQIETFLLAIDREHGTHYCPTGFSRMR